MLLYLGKKAAVGKVLPLTNKGAGNEVIGMGKSFHYDDDFEQEFDDEAVDPTSYKQQRKRKAKQQENLRDKRRNKREEDWQ